MYPWTRRIALVAYLIGGWIVPSVHHHGHVHQGTGQSSCLSQVQAGHGEVANQESASASSVVRSCSCSSHKASIRTTSDSVRDQDDVSRLPVLASGNESTCEGLCAICVSETLDGESVHQVTLSSELIGRRNITAIANLRIASLSIGSVRPRGPPSDV